MSSISRVIGQATVACAFVLALPGCSMSSLPASQDRRSFDTTPVDIVAAHHLGGDYSIEDVSINGQWGGGAGRGGGGGGFVCCVLLPSVWRPGLVAKVKWRVLDWRHEDKEETKLGVYKSIVDEGVYVATVPVEYYSELGSLYIHFFPQAKVRIVASMYGAFGKGHPISKNLDEQKLATVGTPLPEKHPVKPVNVPGQ
jgi:Protein of unknown function (DUF3304)